MIDSLRRIFRYDCSGVDRYFHLFIYFLSKLILIMYIILIIILILILINYDRDIIV